MTIDEAKTLHYGQTIFHKTMKNADKTALRARVNGQVKIWKRNPNKVQVPMAHGLYDHFYITEDNMDQWSIN